MRRWVAWVAWCALAGCGSQESSAPAPDASVNEAGDLCSQFTTSGALCPYVSSKACFRECASGGCFCLESANGGPPRWSCKTDTSCLPDGAPSDDAFAPPNDSGRGEDANDGAAPSDASDGASADGAGDAMTPSDAGDAAD